VTAAQAYELTTRGGGTGIAQVIAACESSGPWCLTGGMAVMPSPEPVYRLDADLVVIAPGLPGLAETLRQGWLRNRGARAPGECIGPGSVLRLRFTTDPGYQAFPERSVEAGFPGVPVRVACLEDTARGKLCAYWRCQPRFSKRKKDEPDLIRLLEARPKLGSYVRERTFGTDRPGLRMMLMNGTARAQVKCAMNYACAMAIGAVSGLRSMVGPAIISQAAHNKVVDVRETPLAWMSAKRVGHLTAIFAGAEMIADKFPFMPDRTGKPALVARFMAGALCGAAVSSARRREERLIGALVGGAAAVVASYIGFEYRKHVELPKFAAAIVEDAVALTAGSAVVSALCA
jgi:uncharacterized membrane protein